MKKSNQTKIKTPGLRKTGGRNNQGRITTRHIGGGFKRAYRALEYRNGDFTTVMSGVITRVEYDPNRTAFLAQCVSNDKTFFKLVGGSNLSKDSEVNLEKNDFKELIGKELKVKKLGEIPIGGSVFNVSLRVSTQGQLARTRGASCKIVKHEGETTLVRMPSYEMKRLNSNNTCQEGEVYGRLQERLTTAGAKRRLGIRPNVRGVAMNPSDHPNGGKTHSGKVKNLWGKLAKWVKTKKAGKRSSAPLQ